MTVVAAPTKVGVVLFPAFQPLDVFGPIDALSMLSWLTKFDVAVIARTLDAVTTARTDVTTGSEWGMRIVPTHTFATAPADLEVLLVPGGAGVEYPDTDDVGQWARSESRTSRLIRLDGGDVAYPPLLCEAADATGGARRTAR